MEINIPRHPEYDEFQPEWKLMRDSLDGERKIKAPENSLVYLPMPSGLLAVRNAEIQNRAYLAYQSRANFPDLVSQTVRGMVGIIHKKPAAIELPAQLEMLRETATRDGLTLDALHRRITKELLALGRCGLLADVSSNGTPYIATYLAEHILNWDEEDDRTSLVVLDESTFKRSDSSQWQWIHEYRRLELVEGRYQVSLIGQDGEPRDEVIEPMTARNAQLDFIPFTFIDTQDLTASPDEIPLLGLARLALRIYRKDADYGQTLYMTSQPTMVFSGIQEEDAPTVIGAGQMVVLPPPDAKAYMLEVEGAGAGSQRQDIIDAFDQATQHGARLIYREGRSAESGEALRLRFGHEAATIDAVAKTSSAGLEQALRNLAIWVGANPDEVHVEAPSEFVEQKLTPQELTALVAAWQSGAIPKRDLHWNLQQGGRVREDIDFEAWEAEAQTEAPEFTGVT